MGPTPGTRTGLYLIRDGRLAANRLRQRTPDAPLTSVAAGDGDVQLARVRVELHATLMRPADLAWRECGAQECHKISRHIAAVADVVEYLSGDVVQHVVKGRSIGQIDRKHEFVVGHGARFYSER